MVSFPKCKCSCSNHFGITLQCISSQAPAKARIQIHTHTKKTQHTLEIDLDRGLLFHGLLWLDDTTRRLVPMDHLQLIQTAVTISNRIGYCSWQLQARHVNFVSTSILTDFFCAWRIAQGARFIEASERGTWTKIKPKLIYTSRWMGCVWTGCLPSISAAHDQCLRWSKAEQAACSACFFKWLSQPQATSTTLCPGAHLVSLVMSHHLQNWRKQLLVEKNSWVPCGPHGSLLNS